MHTNSLNEQVIEMYKNGDSTHTIAKVLGTYPNKVKRILEKGGVTLRDRREAQKNSEENGRYQHPTKGKKHSKEVREKISQNVHKQWAELDDTEKEARRNQAKQNWKNMTDEQKEDFQSRAHKAIRKAADEGSKMELMLVNHLIDKGYNVLHHSKHKVADDQMELDILLPADKIAIEVDGPSHFEPIWGDKALKRNQVADNKKNGILLSNGFHVIRIRDKSKKITRKIERALIECVEEAIKEVLTHQKPFLVIKEVQ